MRDESLAVLFTRALPFQPLVLPNPNNQLMTIKLIFITVLFLVLQGCTIARKSLGHGYSIINRTEEMAGVPGAFEGKSHHQDFYYKSLKLGTVGHYSIAPSGRYALFESNGKLMLFAAESKTLLDETNGRFYIPKNVEWRESEGVVVVIFYDISKSVF